MLAAARAADPKFAAYALEECVVQPPRFSSNRPRRLACSPWLCACPLVRRFLEEAPLSDRDVPVMRPPLWVLKHFAQGDGLQEVQEVGCAA